MTNITNYREVCYFCLVLLMILGDNKKEAVSK